MTTVQDLINQYRNAQEYEYQSILVNNGAHTERHSNVTDLKDDEHGHISFTKVVDVMHTQDVIKIEMFNGTILEKVTKLM